MKCKQTKINTGYNWKCINCNRHDVDKNCNIITKKKAKRDKEVKGYAWVGMISGGICLSTVKPYSGTYVICKAHIKASDYEKLRGKK